MRSLSFPIEQVKVILWPQSQPKVWAPDLIIHLILKYWFVQSDCCSVTKLCLFCNPMVCSMQGSSVLHYLPESAQIHVH